MLGQHRRHGPEVGRQGARHHPMMPRDCTSVQVTPLQRWQLWAAQSSEPRLGKTSAQAGKPKIMLAFCILGGKATHYWKEGGAKDVTATADTRGDCARDEPKHSSVSTLCVTNSRKSMLQMCRGRKANASQSLQKRCPQKACADRPGRNQCS